MQDNIKNLIHRFGSLIASTPKDMFESMNRANKGELFVLHFLSVKGETVTPSELSAALSSSTARISALLNSLEKKGFVVREIDKSNRRNILVMVTEEGRAYAETEMTKIRERMAYVFTEMGQQDTEEFLRLTEKFLTIMKNGGKVND